MGRLLFYLCVDQRIVNMVKKNDKLDTGYGDYVKQIPGIFWPVALKKGKSKRETGTSKYLEYASLSTLDKYAVCVAVRASE